MPLYLQMGFQDQKPRLIAKTKEMNAMKRSPSSTDLFATTGGLSSQQMPPFHPRAAHLDTANLLPLQMTKLQDKCISDAMAGIRETHMNDRAAKRQKLEQDNQDDDGSIACCDSGEQSLLDKLDASPDLAQVVASPGGLITYRKFK